MPCAWAPAMIITIMTSTTTATYISNVKSAKKQIAFLSSNCLKYNYQRVIKPKAPILSFSDFARSVLELNGDLRRNKAKNLMFERFEVLRCNQLQPLKLQTLKRLSLCFTRTLIFKNHSSALPLFKFIHKSV